MPRADWLLVPLAALAALPVAYLLSLVLAPDPTAPLVLTAGTEALVVLAAGAAVALGFDVEEIWHVALWFLAFAAVDFVGIILAGEAFPDGGTASTAVRIAALGLGVLAARATTRRFPFERVRRAVGD